MKTLSFLVLFFASCVLHGQGHPQVKIELPKGSKPWTAERLIDYRGDYEGEELAGSLSLHLRACLDDVSKTIRYAGCLIVAGDVAAKPSMETWSSLRVTKAGLVEANSQSPLFVPIILADGSRGMLVRGVVLKRYGRK